MDDAELNEPEAPRVVPAFCEIVQADADYRAAIAKFNSDAPGATRNKIAAALRRLLALEQAHVAHIERMLSREESEAGT